VGLLGEHAKYTIFVTIFIGIAVGARPLTDFTQNGLKDVNPCKDVPFEEKIATVNPDPRPRKPPKFGPFGRTAVH